MKNSACSNLGFQTLVIYVPSTLTSRANSWISSPSCSSIPGCTRNVPVTWSSGPDTLVAEKFSSVLSLRINKRATIRVGANAYKNEADWIEIHVKVVIQGHTVVKHAIAFVYDSALKKLDPCALKSALLIRPVTAAEIVESVYNAEDCVVISTMYIYRLLALGSTFVDE